MVGFLVSGSTGDPDLSEADLKRLWCHALIQQIPEGRIEEAVEELAYVYADALTPPPPPKPLPQPVRTVKARFGRSVVRPVYPISDEE